MFIIRILTKLFFIAIVSIVIAGCSETEQSSGNEILNEFHLTVYKNASCNCCSKWIDHMRESGFSTVSENENHNSLSQIKEKYGIAPNLRSCHTSVNKDGFVFEGHIPAKFIRQFIQEKPEGAIGLTVPAMPTGTPGMEFGEMLQPYKVYLLKADGKLEIFAEVNSAEEQM